MYEEQKEQFGQDGFSILPDIFKPHEIDGLIRTIENYRRDGQPKDGASRLYAIRNLLTEIPELKSGLLNSELIQVIYEVFGRNYFNVKGIYFDKPANFNWTVAWHQDLMISVDRMVEGLPGFSQWSVKSGELAVRPPFAYTQNVRTIRIHLDPCDDSNGALRVLPGTQREGVLRYGPEFSSRIPVPCHVPAGGIMLMSPLLMHSSHRSSGGRRRVIHLEFSDLELPEGLGWRERWDLNAIA